MQSGKQSPLPSTTQSRSDHRVRNVLVLGLALSLSLLFAVSHATAAVHAKSRTHKAASSHRADVKSKSKKHTKKHTKKHAVQAAVKKNTKKTSTEKDATSSTTKTTTPTSSSNSTPSSSTNSTPTSSTLTTSGATTSSTGSSTSSPGSSSIGTILFNGTMLNTWWLNQSASPTRTQLVADPDGAGDTVQQFTTYNTDVAPLTPTLNPRSQLVTPLMFKPGQTYWESFELYIPSNFTFLKTGWTSLESAVYGYPYNGTPPASISIENGDFRYQRNGFAPTPWQIAWQTPVVKGQWYRFTWHFLLSSTGWVQLYVNDVLQNLKLGTTNYTQMPISMIDKTDNVGPWMSQEQLYYELGMYQSAQVYFKDYKVASTQAAAE